MNAEINMNEFGDRVDNQQGTSSRYETKPSKQHRTTDRQVKLLKISKDLSKYRKHRKEMINHDPLPPEKK